MKKIAAPIPFAGSQIANVPLFGDCADTKVLTNNLRLSNSDLADFHRITGVDLCAFGLPGRRF
jgi:hypothetical protein